MTTSHLSYVPSTGTLNSGRLVTTGSVSAGNVSAGYFNTTSDYRVKDNIKPLNSSFTVDNLNPVIYNIKDTNQTQTGFIAHQLQEEYPFLVNGVKDGETMQSINYQGLIAILVKEIQDLKKEVKILKEKIESEY